MTSERIIGPPDYDDTRHSWKEYKKEVDVWATLTNLSKSKQGPALWMALKGKAKQAIQDMEIDEIKADNGMEKMLEKLDAIFKTDDNQAAYLTYRDFETFVRPYDMNIQDFIIKFESLNSQIKKHNMVLPDGVLAYRFLHSVNLKDEEMKLCRATITEFTYKDMQQKVLSLYGDRVKDTFPSTSTSIKEEPVFYGNHEGYHQRGGYRGSRGGYNKGTRGRGREAVGDRQSQRGREYFTPQKRMNPPGRDGKPSTCAVCSSIYHWAKFCPENPTSNYDRKRSDQAINYTQNDGQDYDNNITLYEKSDRMQQFVGETIGCAVIDSGCSKTVAGKQWVECYLDLLDEDDQHRVIRQKSLEFFTFGKGPRTASIGKITLPAVVGSKNVMIETEIVDADIPMLLSKAALKNARAILDFNNDTAIMFGEKITLIATASGHYAIPLNVARDDNQRQHQIALVTRIVSKILDDDPKKVAEKLHRQFCHCSAERLIRLVQSSQLWKEGREQQIVQ
jgi:hypothetical protein